jgi:hypothetical protein
MRIRHRQVNLKIDEDDVEISAFGIVYTISLLSFLQGRPAGISGIDFKEKDIWSMEDFLLHLSFSQGRLKFYADYVRGRLIKTSIEVHRDGAIAMETVNRADLASQWVDYLQGKRHILEFIGEGGLGTIQ